MAKRTEPKKGGAMKTIKRIFNVFGVLLILLLMALCAFLIYQRVTGREPKLFGYRLFEVQSGSMEPFIMTGDTILTKEIAPDDIKVGDVVVFRNPAIWISVGKPGMADQYIVHRVKKIEKGDDGTVCIVTLGDNNRGIEDLPTKITAVEAKYVGKISGGFFRFLRSPFGIIAVVAAIAAIFAAWRLVYALVEKRKKKNAVGAPDSTEEPDSAEQDPNAPDRAPGEVGEPATDEKDESDPAADKKTAGKEKKRRRERRNQKKSEEEPAAAPDAPEVTERND